MENIDVFRLDGHGLRLFLTLCETRSVSRTAELHDLNQSTVSYALDKLRAAFGDPLFVKSGRGITPTERALAIEPRVQFLLAGLEGLVTPDEYDPMRDTRPINIGISTPALLDAVKLVLAAVEESAPKLQLHVHRLGSRTEIVELLESGKIDVAIVQFSARYPVSLNHESHSEDNLVVYYDGSVRGPVTTVDDYASARHAIAEYSTKSPSVVDSALAELGFRRSVALVSPTASMLADLIRGTDLVATMPSALSNGAYGGLALCPAPLPLPRLKYDVVWHRRNDHSGRNRWIRDHVREATTGPGNVVV